jgi:ABC-type transporter Mla MlaB component
LVKPSEPRPVVTHDTRLARGHATVVIVGPIDDLEAAALYERARHTLAEMDDTLLVCDVGAIAGPDIGTVAALARLTLIAKQRGCAVELRDAAPDLRELLALAGLTDIVPCAGMLPDAGDPPVAGSGVQSRGQPEHRKEALGVEEERDPADPTA